MKSKALKKYQVLLSFEKEETKRIMDVYMF
jgi:hypothetical protein